MTKVSYEEAINSNSVLKELITEGYKTINNFPLEQYFIHEENVKNFIAQHHPPTFDEVVKAWENTSDDKLNFSNNDEGIRVIYPNGLYYLVNLEQVYSNRKVFSMNVEQTLKAINLTVEYLKNRQIIESDKATK